MNEKLWLLFPSHRFAHGYIISLHISLLDLDFRFLPYNFTSPAQRRSQEIKKKNLPMFLNKLLREVLLFSSHRFSSQILRMKIEYRSLLRSFSFFRSVFLLIFIFSCHVPRWKFLARLEFVVNFREESWKRG